MALTIGKLNRRVFIDAPSSSKDAFGQMQKGWTPVRATWASIDTLTGGEALRAQAIVPEASVQIEMRWRDDVMITEGMRVRYGSTMYDIGAAIDVEMRHETLRLICTTGLNRGG
jgi:SPP1 family predicted phage head-tail adaptor